MLISLNWIRDFVDLPRDFSPEALALRFTMTCAEVESVEPIEVGAKGLIAAIVRSHKEIPGTRSLRVVVLDVGDGRIVETVSAAPMLHEGAAVVYGPPGASVNAIGEIGETTVGGRRSIGIILPGDAIGIALAADTAVFLPPSVQAGEPLAPDVFDDWVLEIDNKSITHRPDLWGVYGVARELAAMVQRELAPYPVVPADDLSPKDLPEIPIEIDDPALCPRYTGLRVRGVRPQPAPLWMQLRLGHVGLRPIDCLVDLTNYIMLELGQPMHAFDGDKVERIEVGFTKPGSTFVTLDGVERKLPDNALMILTDRRPIALAGIMGGLETEISQETQSLLLESANFEPATIRRCAAALGLRTDACVRFEKSLDLANTVLAIQRFMHLAGKEFPELVLAARLSDCYPAPARPVTVDVDPRFVARFMGHPIEKREIIEILSPLGFRVEEHDDKLRVHVPGYRATKDVTIEADVIEEIARYVGYDNIEPVLPEMEVRCFEPNAQHELEQASLRLFCNGLGFTEVQDYAWYRASWLRTIGYDPGECITVRNPSAAGLDRMRRDLMPGLLAAVELNRHHLTDFKLAELGGVFLPGGPAAEGHERRHLGLTLARRRKQHEDALLAELKGVLETWAAQTLRRTVLFRAPQAHDAKPWEHSQKTAAVVIDGAPVGLVSAVPLAMRRCMDEHLSPWSIVWAELDMTAVSNLAPPPEMLRDVPAHPEVDLDFSFLVEATQRYTAIAEQLAKFDHALLRRITYVGNYEGESIPPGRRSLTVRCRIGDPSRTLVDDDIASFRGAFEAFLGQNGWTLRQ